jgi:hypothetical protein
MAKDGKALDKAVKAFVTEALGCGCPDEVFRKMDYEEDPGKHGGLIVLIGERLLVNLIPIGPKSQKLTIEKVLTLLHDIRQERDRRGLNRSRLVIIDGTDSIAVLKELADKAWDRFGTTDGNDGRVHLHVVAAGDIPKALKARLGF